MDELKENFRQIFEKTTNWLKALFRFFRTYCAKMLINSSKTSFAGIKYEKVNDKYTKFTWRDSRRLQTDSRNIDFSSKITNKNSKLPSLRSM
ncbi:hypothetical protein QUB56_35220 [Microcoleus sp. AR_TQ3_B6]|uniref:hypothetical protein n=1 Tax=Microcoleus sp. AR_TQ3_B6 TaxID=3055284 RepID=UPI002FCFECCF